MTQQMRAPHSAALQAMAARPRSRRPKTSETTHPRLMWPKKPPSRPIKWPPRTTIALIVFVNGAFWVGLILLLRRALR